MNLSCSPSLLRFQRIRVLGFFPQLRILVAFGLTLSLFLTTLVSFANTSFQSSDNDYFLLYQDVNGDVVCRVATAAERRNLEKINPKNLKQINHVGINVLAVEPQNDLPAHLTIILRATVHLEAVPAAKAAFIRAASNWENLINSPVTIYVDADYGPDNFGQAWGSGVLGSTSSVSSSFTYSMVRNQLIAGANTPGKLAVYNALPSTTVPTDLGDAGSISVSGSIARAIGLLPATADPADNAARIGFNSGTSFDFDSSDGVTAGQIDFESVATHEIGHALGFTSRSGSGSLTPAMWDLYRFRSGTTSGTFTSAQRIMTIGGPTTNSQYYFVPGETELGLSDGGPSSSTDNNADGNQSSHWRQRSLNGGVYIGIMDPRISSGVSKTISVNDTNAANIFGYNSNTVTPPAAPPNDNFTSSQIINGCSGSISGTNVSATKETGEPNHSPDNGGGSRSVWYQWLALTTGTATITTAGSEFDTVLAVYTGNSVSSLTTVGKSDDNSATDKTSTVTFGATAGTTYMIAVDGYNNGGAGGDFGSITLNWGLTNCGSPAMQIMLEESGPGPNQAAALDAILFVRDPFPVVNGSNLFSLIGDPNTRVLIFVTNLQLAQGETASAVTVNLIDSNNQSQNILAQDVRSVPNQAFTQVTFRLPNGLPVGTCQIKVIAHGLTSTTATLRIKS